MLGTLGKMCMAVLCINSCLCLIARDIRLLIPLKVRKFTIIKQTSVAIDSYYYM